MGLLWRRRFVYHLFWKRWEPPINTGIVTPEEAKKSLIDTLSAAQLV
jgi:hypothetical protein